MRQDSSQCSVHFQRQGAGFFSPATDGQEGLEDAWYLLAILFYSSGMVWTERMFPDNCSFILGSEEGALYGLEEPITCLKPPRLWLSSFV